MTMTMTSGDLAISLDLPLPPTINHYYGQKIIRKYGKAYAHRYIKPEGIAFRYQVRLMVQSLKNRGELGNIPLTGRLKLEVILGFNKNGKNDLDNRLKALQDGLAWAGLFVDDSQIDCLIINRGDCVKKGHCLVKLAQIAKEPADE